MSLVGTTNEQKIWNYLLLILNNNPVGVAAVIGAGTYPESGNIPTNLQNTYEKKLGMTDAQYTTAVDNGTYTKDQFIHDSAGYGLCQWTYWSRKQKLYEHCKSKNVSIGDMEAQLEYLVIELHQYGLLTKLQQVKDLREASNIILLEFEKPASKDTKETQDRRFGYTQETFNRCAKTTTTTPATTTATTSAVGATVERVINVAIAEIGYHEKASNTNLDDKTANSGSGNYTKYARDFDEKYPGWYNGKKNGYAWCDMWVDWCMLTAFDYDTALRLLCQPEKSAGAGCTYSLKYYKDKGQFFTSGPRRGDQIFFGKSLSNVQHTGLVEKADSVYVYTIEGNTSDMVARRTYKLTDPTILGYGRPNYPQTYTPISTQQTVPKGYSNSPLVTYTNLTKHHSGQRNHVIDRITIHCFVGQVTAKSGTDFFVNTDRDCSCNYVVAKDGGIGLSVEEKNRSWCTSSGANDHRAVTIETASDTTHPYAVTDAAYKALINLCADICLRNGKKRVTWLADKDKSINYAPAADEMIFTVHRWFAAKACPGDYLYQRHADIAAQVNKLLGNPVVVPQTPQKPTEPVKPSSDTPKRVTATKAAQEKDKSLAGSYTVTTDLNCRNGANTVYKSLCVIPAGTKVMNYGYYTVAPNGVKWLYIQFTLNGTIYTGFSSSNYLRKN